MINKLRNHSTFPIKADEPPRRAIPTATLAGAPPGAFLNAGASAKESPLIVGTKSMSISPKQTTREESFLSDVPSLDNALTITGGKKKMRQNSVREHQKLDDYCIYLETVSRTISSKSLSRLYL